MHLDDSHPANGAGGSRRLVVGMIVVLAAVVLMTIGDLISDFGEGTSVRHVLIEAGIVAVALGGLVVLILQLRRLHAETVELRQTADELAARLSQKADESAHWRAEAEKFLTGLGAVIDRQFDRWELTAAEKEVGLLLLKGLSHKDIARVRSVSEATARQQARAVYRKAGLDGRHDLAAFFLEGLLLPSEPAAER